MLKIIHGADFHLDSPFAGLSPERAAQRRGEQRELLDRLAGLAREKQADLVLLAGDLLDSERVFRETAQALRAALAAIPCPVFIAPGNHDFYSPRSVWTSLDWLENVHIFTSDALEAVELPGCTLWGRAFSDAHQTACPLEGLAVPGDGRLHIACVHGCVGTGNDYGPITPGEIAASGLDYLALGHVHQTDGPHWEGEVPWAYPGCPEGRGFDETGDKGVLYVEVDRGVCRAELVPLAQRRYQILDVNLTGAENVLQAIERQLPERTQRDVYRLRLTGERGMEQLDLEGLRQALAPRFYGLQLRDHTRLARDLWARLEEDSLTGLFLQEMELRRRQEPDNEILELAVRFGLAALEGGEDVVP